MRYAKRKKCILLAVGTLAAGFVAIFGTIMARAVFDGDTEAVHINPDEIENSTLIIGTHLIHISVLNDEIYDVAIKTTQVSGQTELYYKSELSNGDWYMISDASELFDIISPEKKVDSSVIHDLYIRFHTRSDGITYDLLENTAVCIFNTSDPYTLLELSEMDAIKTQMDNLQQKENKSATDEKNLSNLLLLSENSDNLKERNQQADETLASLNEFYIKNVQSPEADTLMEVMKQVDSGRRADVLEELSEKLLPDLLNQVQLGSKEKTDGLYVDYDLTAAIGTALEEVHNSLIEYESEALQQGEHSVSQANYNLIQELSKAAKAGNEEEVLSLAESIGDLAHIESGITVNPDRESLLITETLLPLADANLKTCTDAEEFQKALSEGEFLAKAAAAKMSFDNAEKFLEERITQTDAVLEELKTLGSLNNELYQAVQGMAEDSKNTLRAAMAELSSQNTDELGELLEKKKDLQTKRLSELDNNRLTQAEALERELEALETEINALEKKLTDILNSDTAGAAEKARARAALQSGLAASQIEAFKESILEALKEGQYDQISDLLEGMKVLAQSSPVQVLNALKEAYKSAVAKLYLQEDSQNKDGQNKELEKILGEIEDITADIAPLVSSEPDKDTLMENLENALDKSLTQYSDKEQAAALIALEQYTMETGNANAKKLVMELVTDCYNADNSYVYLKLKNETESFIPLDTFAKCSQTYRYIYHDGNKTGILRKRTEFYEFTAFSATVKKQENMTEQMDTYARYQTSIYVSSEYMNQTFQVFGQSISDTEYAILLFPDMEELITGFLEALTQEGGR
ncbi:MAG: hypothetical protein K2N61_01540 [Lachnospiraceae bacterium]|nr:hypothetical protein [Lachnospiraceae bacterium]